MAVGCRGERREAQLRIPWRGGGGSAGREEERGYRGYLRGTFTPASGRPGRHRSVSCMLLLLVCSLLRLHSVFKNERRTHTAVLHPVFIRVPSYSSVWTGLPRLIPTPGRVLQCKLRSRRFRRAHSRDTPRSTSSSGRTILRIPHSTRHGHRSTHFRPVFVIIHLGTIHRPLVPECEPRSRSPRARSPSSSPSPPQPLRPDPTRSIDVLPPELIRGGLPPVAP